MQKRIDFFGQFQPTGVDPSVAERARSLSNLAQTAGNIAFKIGSVKRAKEGKLAGQQAVKRDEKGNLIAPKQESDFTIFGQNFNKATTIAYKSQIEIDAKEELNRIQNENKLDPEAFKAAAQRYKQGTLNGMPEELAAIISPELDSSISNRLSSVQNNFFQLETQKQKAIADQKIESGVDDLLNATRKGEDTTAIEVKNAVDLASMVDAGLIDARKAQQIVENTKERVQEQEQLGNIDRIIFNDNFSLDEKISKGIDFLSTLKETDLKDLSPEQKDSLVNVVSSKIKGLVAQKNTLESARDLQKEKVISNLKVETNLIEEKAKNGESVDLSGIVERVETLHNNGDILRKERTSLLTHVAKANDDINRIALADKRIIARLQGDNSITMQQKDVDFFYKRKMADDIESLPADIQAVANADFIKKTRVIPSQVKQKVSNNIFSGDPDLIKEASTLIDRIDNVPGLSEKIVTPNQRAFVDNVVSLSESLSPEEAIKIAKENTNPANTPMIEAREAEIKTEKYPSDYESIVSDEFSSLFGDSLTQGVNKEKVTKEYKDLFESYFKNGMPFDRAKSKALEQLHVNWKESDFGFMKYRPEDYYSVGGETSYIKDQLTKDITTSTVGFSFNKDKVFLVSDDETARTASQGAPSYKVLVIDNNGEFQRINGRWKPDVKSETDRQIKENGSLFEGKKTFKQRQKEIMKKISNIPGVE